MAKEDMTNPKKFSKLFSSLDKDAIDTANESEDPTIIEALLRFFCETSEKECFCATLYTCFSHISPDIALELAWLNGYHNFVMPYFIQNLRQTHSRIAVLEERTAPPKENENQDEVAQTYAQLGGLNSGMLMLENGGGFAPTPTSYGGQPDMSGFGVPGMAPNGMPPVGMPTPNGMPPNGMPGMMPTM